MRKTLRSQSAMEYLMTYGWAILIIAVVLGALFQLGVFNSSSFSPRAPPGACQVVRPSGPLTTMNINLMGVCTGQLPQYVGQFNGASGYVSVGNGAGLNAYPLSVVVWTKTTDSEAANKCLVNKYIASSYNGFMMWFNGGRVWGYYYISGTSYIGQTGSSGYINDGNWHQLVFTANDAGGQFYTDGVLKNTQPWTGTPGTITTTQALQFGISPGTTPLYFNGAISNIQIYNASLSANQIQALYLEGIGGAPMKLQNLVGWWPLNGNANDYSGNNNNGVPTNVVFTSQYGK